MSTNARFAKIAEDLAHLERELETQDRALAELLTTSRSDEGTLTIPQADLDAVGEACTRRRVVDGPRATGIRC